MIMVFTTTERNDVLISFLFFNGSNGALLQVLTGSYFAEKLPKVWLAFLLVCLFSLIVEEVEWDTTDKLITMALAFEMIFLLSICLVV